MNVCEEKSGPSRRNDFSNPSKIKETMQSKNIWENPDIKKEISEDRVMTWSTDTEKRKEDSESLVYILEDEQFLSKFGPTTTIDSSLPETSVDTKTSYLETIPSSSSHQVLPKAENSDFQDTFLPLKIKKEEKVQMGYSNPQNSNPSSFFSPPSQLSTPGTNYTGYDFQFDNERFSRSRPLPSYRNGENLASHFPTSIRDPHSVDYSSRINNPAQSFGFHCDDEYEVKYADSPYFIEEFCQYASFCNDSSPLHNGSESSEATVPNIPDMSLRVQNSTFTRNEKNKEENVSHLNYETLDQSRKQLNNHFNHFPDLGASSQNQGARPERPHFYPEPYFHESVKLFTEDREEHVAPYNHNDNGNQTGFNNANEAFFQNTPSFDEPLQFDFGRNQVPKVENAQLNANIGNEMPALTPRATSEIKENAVNSFQVLQSPDLPIEPNSPESFRKDTSENPSHSLSPLRTEDTETTLDPAAGWTDNSKLRSKLMVVLEKYIPPVNKIEWNGQPETGEVSEEMDCNSSETEGNSHVPRHSDVPKLLRKRKHSTSDASSVNLQIDPPSCCDIPPPKKERKQFQCDHCPKVYVRKHFFIKHVQSCGTVKAYKCNDCNKTYATKTALKTHRRSHSKERYECDVCEKVYVRLWCYRKHMTGHLVIHLYLCLLCRAAFRNRAQRDLHLRRMHGL